MPVKSEKPLNIGGCDSEVVREDSNKAVTVPSGPGSAVLTDRK